MIGEDLATFLEANDLGEGGSTIFVGALPPEATGQTVTLIMESGGQRSDVPRGILFPTIQITARSPSYDDALALAWQIHDLLNARGGTVMGSSLVQEVRALQPPFALARDEHKQARIVCNYLFEVNAP